METTDTKRQFKGIWIPAELWTDTALTWMEKLMLAEINSLCGELGCFASNSYLGEFFQLSPSRVSEIIKGLKNKGFIKIEYEYNGKEIKKRTIWVFGKQEDGIRDTEEGYSEKANRVFGKGERESTKRERPSTRELVYKPLPDAENVKITENDYQQLVKKYGNTVIQNIILDLDNYIVNGKGRKYKDHKRVIETWLRHRGVAPVKKPETVQEAREREERQRQERAALKAQREAACGSV